MGALVDGHEGRATIAVLIAWITDSIMNILDTLLRTPVDVNALISKGAVRERLLDGAFCNLLHYAKSHWSYTASGSTGGDALLAGTAVAAPCGGIATALKRVFTQGLGVPEGDIEYIRVTGYVWTGPEYLCFDPKVTGNLRRLDQMDYRNGCVFNEHYYLKCSGRYYDPCLSTTYLRKDQSIKASFSGLRILTIGTNRKMLITEDKHTILLYMPQERVQGFQGAWAMFDATKKQVEKALGTKDYKAEMAALKGATTFAKFVNSLP